jgi:hypothetical protein
MNLAPYSVRYSQPEGRGGECQDVTRCGGVKVGQNV